MVQHQLELERAARHDLEMHTEQLKSQKAVLQEEMSALQRQLEQGEPPSTLVVQDRPSYLVKSVALSGSPHRVRDGASGKCGTKEDMGTGQPALHCCPEQAPAGRLPPGTEDLLWEVGVLQEAGTWGLLSTPGYVYLVV